MADKIMETAREIASERYQGEQWEHMRQFFRDGLYDNDPVVVSAAKALRAAPQPAHGTSATERETSDHLLAENAALRKIISDAAAALPNGAFIHPQASVGFMEGLPKEIALVCAALKSEGK